jgi:DNA topoisomerase-1
LVKELEAQGIGRPSTYAQIITTIIDREYVEKVDNRYFEATERGQTVNKLLVDTFPDLFNVDFTANMEDQLDRVEEGDDDWVATVEQFYNSWKDNLAGANERRKELKLALQEESDIQCEECERMMVIKWGRNGRFLACPGYPECKNTKPLEEQDTVETDAVSRLQRLSRLQKCQTLFLRDKMSGGRLRRRVSREAVPQGQSLLWL